MNDEGFKWELFKGSYFYQNDNERNIYLHILLSIKKIYLKKRHEINV